MNWIWNRDKTSSSSGKDSPDQHSDSSLKKHSFLSKKGRRKDRHISCPDITVVASNNSSRSTSPVSFKVSLTSLFGSYSTGHHGHHSGRPHSASQMTSTPNSTLVRRHPKGRASVTVSSLPTQQVVTATEIVDELRPVQFCQTSDPYECFYIELCNAQIHTADVASASSSAR